MQGFDKKWTYTEKTQWAIPSMNIIQYSSDALHSQSQENDLQQTEKDQKAEKTSKQTKDIDQQLKQKTEKSRLQKNQSKLQDSNKKQGHEQNSYNQHDLDFLLKKIVNQQYSSAQDDFNLEENINKLELSCSRLKNSKWITKLDQISKNFIRFPIITQSLKQFQDRIQNTSIEPYCQENQELQNQQNKDTFEQKTYPDGNCAKIQILYNYSLQKIKKHRQRSPFKLQCLTLEQYFKVNQSIKLFKQNLIQISIDFDRQNQDLLRFISGDMFQKQYSKSDCSIQNYLTNEQLIIIKQRFPHLSQYIKSWSLNSLFLIRVLSLKEIFTKIAKNVTLLEKIVALRRHFSKQSNKYRKNNQNRISQKEKVLPEIVEQYESEEQSFSANPKFQLHGKKQLLQQLWNIYGQNQTSKQAVKYEGNINSNINKSQKKQSNIITESQNMKFVQFIPNLQITLKNYPRFLKNFSEIKKSHFNGLSVGFRGFRLQNFTRRSENNITFVFQQFHELVLLQSLLIDFQFPMNYIKLIQQQYESLPNKKLKKIKMKFYVSSGNNSQNSKKQSYSNELNFINQTSQLGQISKIMPNNQNKITSSRQSILQPKLNQTIMFRPASFSTGNENNNSSFYLNPLGYYQKVKIEENRTQYTKQFYFYKLDSESPKYQHLIDHLNSFSSVSKTIIIDFEKIFEIFALRSKLTSLINICCNFEAIDLHILPQPLQIVKDYQDFKQNIVDLKRKAQQLLENQDKFSCFATPKTNVRINAINSFNIVKHYEQSYHKLQIYNRINKKFGKLNEDGSIFNSNLQQSIFNFQFILPHPRPKNQFICFPFHKKVFKIVSYFEPVSNRLLSLNLQQTNERTQKFFPFEQTALNQHKQNMKRQGLDFFYFSYPFGQKFKINIQASSIYSLGLRNELRFRTQDHLKVLFWLGKINKIKYRVIFYENPLSRPFLSKQKQQQMFIKCLINQKLPYFQKIYNFGFVDEKLKQKIAQIQIYSSKKNKKPQQMYNNEIFKKSIQKILLVSNQRIQKNQSKLQSYKIQTNRRRWQMILKKLQTICEQKSKQLLKITYLQEDEQQFQELKKTAKYAKMRNQYF